MDVGTLTFALLLMATSAGLVIAHVYAWRGERSRQAADSLVTLARLDSAAATP